MFRFSIPSQPKIYYFSQITFSWMCTQCVFSLLWHWHSMAYHSKDAKIITWMQDLLNLMMSEFSVPIKFLWNGIFVLWNLIFTNLFTQEEFGIFNVGIEKRKRKSSNRKIYAFNPHHFPCEMNSLAAGA